MSRRNYYTGKYKLDKHELLSAIHFALQYNKWKDEYKALEDSGKGIRYDKDRVQSSNTFDPVEAAGLKRAQLSRKIELVERTAHDTDVDLSQWILQSVTDEFATYAYLSRVKKIPCSRNTLSRMRRKFFYLLAQRI